MSEASSERRIGRYVLHGVIASGGMARVHLGRLVGEAGFSRTVAIKRLRSDVAEDSAFAASLIDEARIASRIRHPNVVPTLDVLEHEGELLVVMEYVHGESLAVLLGLAQRAGKPVAPRVAAAIVAEACEGLHAAHEAKSELGEPLGIVHRDVSPHNVLVGADGHARVLDFGVAKARGRLQSTGAGQVKGKLAYMAPEQLLAKEVDRRTDVYAACVVLWEALAGRRALRADDDAGLIGAVLAGIDTPPSAHAPEVSQALDRLVMRGLAREPEHRYSTSRELARALEDEIGLASPRQVAEWMAELAAQSLEVRAAEVARLERGAVEGSMATPGARDAEPPPSTEITRTERGDAAPPAGQEPAAGASQATNVSVATHVAPPKRSGSRTALLIAAVGAVAIVAVLQWGRLARDVPGETTDPSVPPRPAEVHAAPPSEPPSEAPPAASAVAAPERSPPSAPSQAALPRSAPRASAEPATPKTAAPATPTAKPGCDPPYSTDARGIRRLKPECL